MYSLGIVFFRILLSLNGLGSYVISLNETFGFWVVLGSGFIILLVFFICGFGLYKLYEHYEYQFKQWRRKQKLASGKYYEDNWGYLCEISSESHDGLFKSMWNAILDKVCPMIEIID